MFDIDDCTSSQRSCQTFVTFNLAEDPSGGAWHKGLSMERVGCNVVEVRSGKVSGVPLVRGSRVQADTVLESFQLGETPEEIADSFQLDPEDIRALLSSRGSACRGKRNGESVL